MFGCVTVLPATRPEALTHPGIVSAAAPMLIVFRKSRRFTPLENSGVVAGFAEDELPRVFWEIFTFTEQARCIKFLTKLRILSIEKTSYFFWPDLLSLFTGQG